MPCQVALIFNGSPYFKEKKKRGGKKSFDSNLSLLGINSPTTILLLMQEPFSASIFSP